MLCLNMKSNSRSENLLEIEYLNYLLYFIHSWIEIKFEGCNKIRYSATNATKKQSAIL